MQVIEATDSSDSSMNNVPIPTIQEQQPQVEVFILQNNGQPLHMIQDDIQEAELMEGIQEEQQGTPNNEQENMHLQDMQNKEQENMQLGFVDFIESSQDPVFAQMYALRQSFPISPTTEVFRQWFAHFTSEMDTQKVEVPFPWAHFFTAQLLNPLNFLWAKNFLSSSALQFLPTDFELQLA